MTKKLLYITYIYPPMGGAGVQRAVKFIKYLPEYGWRAAVLTVEDPPTPVYDDSLSAEVPADTVVGRAYSLEPTRIIQRLRRKKTGENRPASGGGGSRGYSGLPGGVVRLIQAFFIPDEKRGWVKYAVPLGLRLIEQEGIDAILSSGPPFTVHLVASRLKAASGLPWVADFRDPWVGNFFIRPPTSLHDRLIKRMERRTVIVADKVISAAPSTTAAFKGRYPELAGKFSTVTNGFDGADFGFFSEIKPDEKFTIFHMGTFYGDRNPINFLKALSRIVTENPAIAGEIRVKFVGPSDQETESAVRESGVGKLVELIPYQPHHECLRLMAAAHALLLIISAAGESEKHLAGKTFEYLAARKPILALVGPGEAERMIVEAGAGTAVDPNDVAAIKAAILDLYSQFKEGRLKYRGDDSVISRYDRRALTAELARVLDEVSRA